MTEKEKFIMYLFAGITAGATIAVLISEIMLQQEKVDESRKRVKKSQDEIKRAIESIENSLEEAKLKHLVLKNENKYLKQFIDEHILEGENAHELRYKATEEVPLNDLESSKNEFPLQLGSEGNRVERLQIYLMRNLGWVRQPNEHFDLLTEQRVLKSLGVKEVNKALYEELMLDKMVHDQHKQKVA